MRWTNDTPTEEEVIQWYLELHPDAQEADVREEMKREIERYEGKITVQAPAPLEPEEEFGALLIDLQTGPYSSVEEIKAELAETLQLQKCPERDAAAADLRRWIRAARRREAKTSTPTQASADPT